MTPREFEKLARDINAQMDLWIKDSKTAGTWDSLASTAGQEYYTSLVVAALHKAFDAGRREGMEEAAGIADEYGEIGDNSDFLDRAGNMRAKTVSKRIRSRASGMGGEVECNHTPCPQDYLGWHAWAEKMNKTHKQIKCASCGLFAVWVAKRRKSGEREKL